MFSSPSQRMRGKEMDTRRSMGLRLGHVHDASGILDTLEASSMFHRMKHRHSRVRCGAFTLIEVLVVVAIIALLIAILLPSLAKARIQAKLAVDKSNCKQIATVMATYQTESQGAVPIVFNYGAEEYGHNTTPTKWAGNALLPVAFRNYERGLKNLRNIIAATDGLPFDPNTIWVKGKRQEFETRLMPEHYACPFGKAEGAATSSQTESIFISGVQYATPRFEGRGNSYVTDQWEGQNVRGFMLDGEQYPGTPGNTVVGQYDGRPKYSALSWCAHKSSGNPYPKDPQNTSQNRPGSPPADFIPSASGDMKDKTSAVMNRFRKWNEHSARLQNSSLSEMTAFYCMIGQSMGTKGNNTKPVAGLSQIYNYGSHPTGQGGGTNAAFGDTHVEWVKGTQIGWP